MVRKNAKNLIETALVGLLTEQALDKIDVQDIAEAANLSRQTFYYNFKNKQDLLCWILEGDTQLAVDSFHRSGNLHDYIYSFITTAQGKGVFYRAIAASDARRRSYTAYFENGLLACAQQAESRSGNGRMNSAQWDALHFFTFGASGMMQNWVENGMQMDPDMLAETVMRNLPPSVDRYLRSTLN